MFKMWRLQTLLSYVRGGVRSGWRVREPPSKLVSDERERDCQEQQQQDGRRQRRGRTVRPPEPRLVETAQARPWLSPLTPAANGGTARLPSAAALWCLSGGLLPVPGVGTGASQPLESVGPIPARSEPDLSRRSEQHTAAPEPTDPLSALRIAFATESDRLLAELQNSAGASVAAQRPAQALECFRRAAALGSAPGWFNAGVCFQEGTGTARDEDKAAACFAEAARLGHAAAAYNLALLLAGSCAPLTSQWRRDVTELLQQAAAGGCAEAAAYLPVWSEWCDSCRPQDDPVTSEWPPGRSLSLPALSDSDPDSEACLDPRVDCYGLAPDMDRRPLFYLNEAP